MLTLEHVTKRFDGVVAVDDLSFCVPDGVIFGFLGPNGAGKTTTMRMILNIIRPDHGSITWRGRAIGSDERLRFGYLPEERGLYEKMKVKEQLIFFARLFGAGTHTAVTEVDEALARLGIADRANSRLEELSRGNRQKVQLIVALLGEPDLVLLDEPFTGLDPLNVGLLEERLLEFKNAGKTVVLSSHRMGRVEELCDEVAIISRGRLKLSGGVKEIRNQAVRRVINVRTVSGRVDGAAGLGLSALLPARDHLRFALEPDADPQAVLAGLIRREQVDFFALERPSLQEIFVATVREDEMGTYDDPQDEPR
jgi:ABC-2 type transport system ATP-binding protein